jgi:phage terminase small subunit
MSGKKSTESVLKHPCPDGLGDAGRDLWGSIVSDLPENWELDHRELHLLEEACLVADQVTALDAAVERDGHTVSGSRGQPTAHPALAESRQLRALQLRLLGSLELSDPLEAVSSATPAQAKQRRAAKARWERENRRMRR